MKTKILLSIFFLTVLGYMLYSGFNPAPENEVSSITDISKANNGTKFGNSGANIPSTKNEDDIPLPLEASTSVDSQVELEQKVGRLIELESVIDTGNNKLSALIVKYDEVLGDEGVRQELSSALLDSKEYRLGMIEKFKLEQDLKQ
ncbi:MAG: hypothetical protein GY814_11435 [Gammaproteobacteria bacterium]|nr:hypothetical protein [Gammaproteobacteria bacterium]